MPELVLVGPVAPPSGGVATHVADVAAALTRRAVACRVVRDRRAAVLGVLWPARGALVHCHVPGHNGGSYALCALLAARPGRTVVTLHSGLAPSWLRRLTPARRRGAGAILRALDAVVCVGEPVAAAVRALGVPGDRVLVAPAFIAEGMTPAAPPRHLSTRAGRVIACAVAPGAEYGGDLLVEAFARIAPGDPDLLLVVFGPGGASEAVACALAARGLGGRVRALGELPRREALGVLTGCDLFVRPTRADGDAISVREARALGRRVVASDAAARPAGCVPFRSGDAAGLAAALGRALAGPAPPADRADGLAPLLELYARLGIDVVTPREPPCAGSPAA